MTDDRSLERAARSWIEAGPTRAPDRAVEAALLRIQTTPQERDLRVPWRFPPCLHCPRRRGRRHRRAAGRRRLVHVRRGDAPPVGVPPRHRFADRRVGGRRVADSPDSAVRPRPGRRRWSRPRGPRLAARRVVRRPVRRWAVAFLTRSQELGFCGGCGRTSGSPSLTPPTGTSGYILGPDVDAARDLTWSPDGSRLAFVDADETGNSDIYVVDVGSEPGDGHRRRDPAPDDRPRDRRVPRLDARRRRRSSMTTRGAEPDSTIPGSRAPRRSGECRHGGDPVRLTTNEVWDAMPDVAPDGTVVFAREGAMWTMNLDGTDQRDARTGSRTGSTRAGLRTARGLADPRVRPVGASARCRPSLDTAPTIRCSAFSWSMSTPATSRTPGSGSRAT